HDPLIGGADRGKDGAAAGWRRPPDFAKTGGPATPCPIEPVLPSPAAPPFRHVRCTARARQRSRVRDVAVDVAFRSGGGGLGAAVARDGAWPYRGISP